MREDKTRSEIRLRLLTLVLTLALTWYAINPAPGPVMTRKPKRNKPVEKRPKVVTYTSAALFSTNSEIAVRQRAANRPLEDQSVDELDWPEYLALD